MNDEITRMEIKENTITAIIDAKEKFSEQGYIASHIIFPKPVEDYLYIGEGKFKVIEGVEMGTVFGLKIYVDAKAKSIYLVDVNPFLSLVNDFVVENPPNFLGDNIHQVIFDHYNEKYCLQKSKVKKEFMEMIDDVNKGMNPLQVLYSSLKELGLK